MILSIIVAVHGEGAYLTSRLKCAFALSASNQEVKAQLESLCVRQPVMNDIYPVVS